MRTAAEADIDLGTNMDALETPVETSPGPSPLVSRRLAQRRAARDEVQPTFSQADIATAYRTYVADHVPSPRQVQALRLLDCVLTGVWPQLSWSVLRQQAAERVLFPEKIDQGTIGVCAPAAVVNALVDTDPIAYVAVVRKIFTRAEFNGKKASARMLARQTPTTVPQVDWMVLNVIGNAANEFLPNTGKEHHNGPDTGVTGTDIGAITTSLGVQNTEDMSSLLIGDVANTRYVSDLLAKHGNKNLWVFALVNACYLSIPGSEGAPWGDFHWIRILEPAVFGDNTVTLKFFSWGQTFTHTYPLPQFRKLLFHYHLAARSLGVLE